MRTGEPGPAARPARSSRTPRTRASCYGSCKGQYSVMNLDTGQEKHYWIGAQSLYGNPASDLVYRMQRVSPMALSPHDPDVLYYGSQFVHRTRDRGVTWETISPDLTARPACCQGVSGEPITRDVTGEEFYSTLYALAESPLERGVIWAGSNDGPFHVTRDDGRTWSTVTPNDLPPGGRVQWIDVSPHRRGSAYFAVYRYLLGDYQPYLYRTEDYGTSWTRLTTGSNGIPDDFPTRVVREDPDREGLLYAGTEFGMFVSFDNGAHWQSLQLNLPVTPITDIRVHRKDLIVATQGRAFWILDNVSALHQIGARPMTGEEVVLYKPRDGYRTTVGALGPMIDYYLPAAAAGAVTIEIADAHGTVVNTYSSETPPGAARAGRGAAEADPDDPDTTMGAGPAARSTAVPGRVTRNAGVNRFTWDVRHESGLPVPPGAYQVRLSAGGKLHTQPFLVLIDPNVAADGVTEADLKGQFDHNLRARELVTRVSETITRVREAQAMLKSAPARDASTAAALDSLEARLVGEPVRYGKPGLQAHITYLAGMTTRADQRVGRDALERYAVLKKKLDVIDAEVVRLRKAPGSAGR